MPALSAPWPPLLTAAPALTRPLPPAPRPAALPRRGAGKYRRYNYGSLRDLLRVIRNKHNHFRELPPELQKKAGGGAGRGTLSTLWGAL